MLLRSYDERSSWKKSNTWIWYLRILRSEAGQKYPVSLNKNNNADNGHCKSLLKTKKGGKYKNIKLIKLYKTLQTYRYKNQQSKINWKMWEMFQIWQNYSSKLTQHTPKSRHKNVKTWFSFLKMFYTGKIMVGISINAVCWHIVIITTFFH